MELANELICQKIGELALQTLLKSQIDYKEIVEMECYKTLQKIKTVIENDSLNDFECVEEIVCIFESLGSNGGNRHDFG